MLRRARTGRCRSSAAHPGKDRSARRGAGPSEGCRRSSTASSRQGGPAAPEVGRTTRSRSDRVSRPCLAHRSRRRATRPEPDRTAIPATPSSSPRPWPHAGPRARPGRNRCRNEARTGPPAPPTSRNHACRARKGRGFGTAVRRSRNSRVRRAETRREPDPGAGFLRQTVTGGPEWPVQAESHRSGRCGRGRPR